MIMNIVLDRLETQIDKEFPRWKIKKVNFISNTDDIVITAISKEVISEETIPLITWFLIERGLELSAKNSKITNISEGFNFLSQNVPKFNGKLVIRPSKKICSIV